MRSRWGNARRSSGPLIAALSELNSRLSVEMPFADYGQKVGDARVAYDALDTTSLAAGCVSVVGVPAEKALDVILQAYASISDGQSHETQTTL
jgi:hypothetical protein